MRQDPPDPRAPIDTRIDTAGREGLTGTAPQSIYKPLSESDSITVAPDGRPMEDQPAWRRDFPIDWPQDLYIERREFTKFMVLTSCAFLCGQLWIGLQSLQRRARGAPAPMRIAALAELAVGSIHLFTYPTEHDPCVLIRLSPEKLVAYSQECTHLSCAVVPKPEAGVIHCPCHEGYFDLESGRPIAGPPPRPLTRITLEVRGADVFATGVEWRTT
jgi:nitrite reductase/ring-hydroxylating ferredoxin subunit